MRGADLLRLMRPWQWYKNVIVFIPLVFSNNAFTGILYRPAALAFVAFCFLASGVYCWNDVRDRAEDAAHPTKRTRPVASGAVPVGVAVVLGAALICVGLVVLAAVNVPTLLMGGLYLALQLLYTVLLKQLVLFDVISIGLGFVLRGLAGTTAIDVGPPTEWLILCTFLFAVFLGLAKRRHELLLLDQSAETTENRRQTLDAYSLAFIERVTTLTAGLLLTSYFLYTFFGTTPWMMLTIPFALFGVFRYLWLTERRDLRSEVEMIFRDRPMFAAALGWILTVVVVLRGLPQAFFAWLEAATG